MTMIKDNIEEIEEEIRLHGDVEWRSKKNLDQFVMPNTFNKDICIVGYITSRLCKNGVLTLKAFLMTKTFSSP